MKLYRAYTLGLVVVLLAGCGMPPSRQVPFTPTSRLPAETRQPQSSPEPSPAVQSDDTLVICSGSFPADLFLYGEPSYIKTILLAMLYDGPIEQVGYESAPVISPDGERVAYVLVNGDQRAIYVMKADGTNISRLTDYKENCYGPSWSPDSSRIAYMCVASGDVASGDADIYIMNADGSGKINLTGQQK